MQNKLAKGQIYGQLEWLTTSTQIYYYLRMYALECPSILFVYRTVILGYYILTIETFVFKDA